VKTSGNLAKSLDLLPWWAKSSLQGLAGGCVVAHIGAAASPLAFAILPFLDIAAIDRARFLMRESKKRRSVGEAQPTEPGDGTLTGARPSFASWMRPVASICLNGVVALTTAPLIAPHTLSSAKTERSFHSLVAEPVTYGNALELDHEVNRLLRSGTKAEDRYWLTKSQLRTLEKKKSTIKATQERRAEDERILKAAGLAISTKVDFKSYDRILSDIKAISLSPRFDVIIPAAKRMELKRVMAEAETMSSQIEKERLAEKNRLEKIRREQEDAQEHDNLCLTIYRQMIQNVATGLGGEFRDMYLNAGCPSDLSRYIGR